jgi:hypothetical protein
LRQADLHTAVLACLLSAAGGCGAPPPASGGGDAGGGVEAGPRDAGASPDAGAGLDAAPRDAGGGEDAAMADGGPPDAGAPQADCARWAEGARCVTPALRWGACQGGACVGLPEPADDPAVCDGDDTDVCADTWVVVDGLGRAVPGADQVGPPRARTVGMFYWIWHEASRPGPYDVTRILAANPGAPQWGPLYAPHHWGEPELGYYSNEDDSVYRRHATLLAEAGVDVLIFDTSNSPFTWPDAYRRLCRVLDGLDSQGELTPKIAFLAPFWSPAEVMRNLYRDLYAPGECRAHWFMWEGRPLVMADPAQLRDPACDGCTGGAGCDVACQGIGRSAGVCAHPGSTDPGVCCLCYEQVPTQADFFTFRTPVPGYFDGPSGPDQWGWMEISPQHVFASRTDPSEQVVVSVAQNATDTALKPMSLITGIHGRTWSGGVRHTEPDAVRKGYNFQEQWERALQVDPSFVFVTGWNEWVAGRFDEWSGVGGGAVFPDEYDQEFSRDIEPMRGGHGDDYYYQLMTNVRRYAGARRLPLASPPRTVNIDGVFAEWAEVRPVYRDSRGDTAHRDAPGYGGLRYVERSGRNDVVEARVTWDDDVVSFYVRTAEALTPWSDPGWMVLYVDADHDRATGWRGYELAVGPALSAAEAPVLRLADGQQVGVARLAYAGAELELAVARGLIGQAGRTPALTFHWADNVAEPDGRVDDFGGRGENAPSRRASYAFRALAPGE